MIETRIRFLSALFFALVVLASLDAVSSARLLSRRQATPPPSNDTTAQELKDIVGFLGPRNQVDFVAILQRNQGMGKRNFYTAIRPFMEALTIQYAALHKSYVRMAVVTFSSSASVVYDHVSNAGEGAKTKCEVFGGASPLWDTVVYNNSDTVGANIGQALIVATAILTKGKQNRPNATQVIMVATDGDFTVADDPLPYLKTLQKDMQVKMFAAGLGAWFKPVSVSSLASKVSYYGQMQPHWGDLLSSFRSSVGSDVRPLLSRLPDSGICAISGSNCSDVSSGCYCDVDRGVTECRCDAGHSRRQSSSPILCQVCPNGTYRGELDDDAICLPCSPGYGTVQSSNGTIDTSAGCQCLSGNNCTADPCAAGSNPCSANEICSVNPTTGNVTCSCRPGLASPPSCSVNPDDCSASSQCANGAACYDRLDAVQCVCPFGFRGERCRAQQDYCAFEICVRNQTQQCTSPPNNYVCTCLFGFIGDFCENQDPNPTRSSTVTVTTPAGLTSPSSTQSSSSASSSAAAASSSSSAAAAASTASTTTTPGVNSSSPVSSGTVNEKDGTGVPVNLIIIIVCVVGGVLLILLLVLVIVIATSRRRNRRREEEEKAAAAAAAAEGVVTRKGRRSKRPESFQTPRKYGVASTRNRLSQTISNRFSGLWKKWTVRTHDPSEWYNAGVPSVPIRRPGLDEFNDPHLVDRNEAILKNEVIVVDDQLDGWTSYLKELEKSGVIEGGIIAQSDTHDCAKTEDWRVDWMELEDLEKAIDSRSTKATVRVHGQTYQLRSNDGTMATAVSTSSYPSSSSSEKMVIMGVTRCYLVVVVAEGGSAEQSTKEIQWVVDHITAEGY